MGVRDGFGKAGRLRIVSPSDRVEAGSMTIVGCEAYSIIITTGGWETVRTWALALVKLPFRKLAATLLPRLSKEMTKGKKDDAHSHGAEKPFVEIVYLVDRLFCGRIRLDGGFFYSFQVTAKQG